MQLFNKILLSLEEIFKKLMEIDEKYCVLLDLFGKNGYNLDYEKKENRLSACI